MYEATAAQCQRGKCEKSSRKYGAERESEDGGRRMDWLTLYYLLHDRATMNAIWEDGFMARMPWRERE